jgi:hypothetical protein
MRKVIKQSVSILTLVLAFSCSEDNNDQPPGRSANEGHTFQDAENDEAASNNKSCSQIVSQGKYYESGGKKFLWGGEDPSTHFDISNWGMDECNLYYGLGREHFVVPTTLTFIEMSEVSSNYEENDKTVVLRTNNEIRVYPYKILVKSEMVNDVVDGKPIMVVYCLLADLAAVYSRVFDGNTLVFGVSGFTYSDPEILNGLESFILWDRKTESLWWPIIDKAISGNYNGEKMEKHPEEEWELLRWGEMKSKYPNAKILTDFGFGSGAADVQ